MSPQSNRLKAAFGAGTEAVRMIDFLRRLWYNNRIRFWRKAEQRGGAVMHSKQSAAAERSYRVALGGIVAALCLTVMVLTGVVPALYIAAPMVAGMLMIILAEEVSEGWGWLTYLAVSLLTLLMNPDKEAALMFILFFGYYPLLRPRMQRIRPRWLRMLLKLLLYNAFLVADFWVTVYVLGLPTFEDTLPWMYAGLIAVSNLIFLAYDRLLGNIRAFYRSYFVKKILGKRQ